MFRFFKSFFQNKKYKDEHKEYFGEYRKIYEFEDLADLYRFTMYGTLDLDINRNYILHKGGERYSYKKLESNVYYNIFNRRKLNESTVKTYIEEEKGGMIIFSPVVNQIIDKKYKDKKKGLFIKLKKWFDKNKKTKKNNIFKEKALDKIIDIKGDIGFTAGYLFKGRYADKKKNVFDEKSLSVEIIGLSKNELIGLTEKIANDFQQDTMLVKSYSDNKISLVNNEYIGAL